MKIIVFNETSVHEHNHGHQVKHMISWVRVGVAASCFAGLLNCCFRNRLHPSEQVRECAQEGEEQDDVPPITMPYASYIYLYPQLLMPPYPNCNSSPET